MNLPFTTRVHLRHADEARQKHAAIDLAQLELDVQAVMDIPAGRRLFMRILASGGVYRHSDPNDDRAYAAGRRDAALEIMGAVNRHACAKSLLALQENNAVLEKRNEEIRNAEALDLIERKGKTP